MNLKELKNLKPATTKEEKKFNEKMFKKAIGNTTKNAFKMIKSPTEFINEFEEMLQEGIRIKVLTEEQAKKHKDRLYYELNNPTKFKEDVRNKIEKFSKRFHKQKQQQKEKRNNNKEKK